MDKHCTKCTFKAKYDKNPNTFIGKFWRWHINFCPGWKAYFTSLTATEQQVLREKYEFNKYNAK